MLRTDTCGGLRISDLGRTVTLSGWVARVRNLGALVFVDLRDRYGLTQLNIDPELFARTPLKSEYCVKVTGTVVRRSEANPQLPTGEIEVSVSEYAIYSASELPPFIVADKTDATEETRLKTRYLDLRRPVMQKNLKLRHKMLMAAREFLEGEEFLEVETPTLIKSTPEGARDYLVPSRTRPGSFYALPQSPQIFKQLLMIGGLDRYYQISRCYRDEDLRADRQPEFTQIDVEMSFVDREDVLNTIERLLKYVFKKTIDVDLPAFRRISYREAIDKYGTDKPDMRYEMLLHDVTAILGHAGFSAYEGKTVKALVVEDEAIRATRKTLDIDNELSRRYGLHSVFHFKYQNGLLSGSSMKYFAPSSLAEMVSCLELKEGDLIIVGAHEDYRRCCAAFGALRLRYAKEHHLEDPNSYRPVFVLDWPLFGREEGEIVSLSNPFTRPRDEDLPLLTTDPTAVLSYAYDTVINGIELSSGSLRIYDSEVQQQIFKLLGLNEEDIKNKFGFFVDALKYGTPPHGGFAFGVERLTMIMCQTENIRDVVAFPKNLNACDPMCGAPGVVPESALELLNICLKKGDD